MASTFTFTSYIPIPTRASSGSTRKPDPSRRKPVSASSPTWWGPLFGWSSDGDYINNNNNNNNTTTAAVSAKNGDRSDKRSEVSGSRLDPDRSGSRFALGCFTEEKAKQLRRKTMESSTFHDVMYHSAIASRLASDLSVQPES